jgi:plasmid maintenance system antidote protein VapI
MGSARVQAEEKARKSAQRRVLRRWRKTVGAVIGTSIRDSDRKQFQVAQAVGMSENTLSEIVQGHRKTELGEIVLLAKAIGEQPLVLIRRMLSWHS